jgi:hypothetical protein
MATWKSPIFSDIRNKLGENVVFSMWKGRPYMRSYVRPSNPKTLAQLANRLDMTRLVTLWQSHIATVPADVTAWNKAALSDLISGYNRFIKGNRGFVLDPSMILAHATFEFTLVSTKLPLNEQQLIAVDVSTSQVYPADRQTLDTYSVTAFPSFTPAASDYFVVWDLKAADGTSPTFANLTDFSAPLVFPDETAGTLTPIILT